MTGCMGSQEKINETVMNNLYSTTTSTMETLVAYDNATMEQAMEEESQYGRFYQERFSGLDGFFGGIRSL